jgi:putative ABC transport system permease protein
VLFNALVAGNLRRHPFRVLLNVAAVAVSVAFWLAMTRAGGLLERELRSGLAASDAAAPAIHVFGPGRGVPDRELATIRYAPGVVDASPILERQALVSAGSVAGEPVRVAGIDALRPLPGVARLAQSFPGPDQRAGAPFDPAGLMRDGGVVIAAALAERLKVTRSSVIEVNAGGRRARLPVDYVLPAGTAGVDSGVVFTDISTAQRLFDSEGFVDRIDVEPAGEPGSALGPLAARLPPYLRVERAIREGGAIASLAGSFRQEIARLEIVAAVLAMLLLATTIGASLRERRKEIGTVRTLGASRADLFGTFLEEAALFGALGSTIGIVAGESIAPALAALLAPSRLLPEAYGFGDLTLDLEIGAAGVALATAAALVPALLAAATLPVQTMREPFERPLPIALPLLRGFATRIGGDAGIALRLALADLQRSPRRIGLALSAFAIAVGAAVAFVLVGASFEWALGAWANSAYRADLRVSMPAASGVPAPLPTPLAARLQRVPGVERIERARTFPVTVGGLPVTLRGSDAVPSPQVTPAFAKAHRTSAGDRIRIESPSGPVVIRIDSIRPDFSELGAAVLVPFSVLGSRFHDARPDTIAIYLKPGVAPIAARSSIARALAPVLAVVQTNRELREQVLSLFRGSAGIAAAIAALLLCLSAMAIAVAFSALIVERRRDLALLRVVGASRGLVRTATLVETVLLVLGGGLAGALGGSVAALARLQSIGTDLFGAALPIRADVPALAAIAAAAVAAALAAGLIAGRQAARVPIDSVGLGR